MRFDSCYSILKDFVQTHLGVAGKKYDSCYSILLDILDNIGGGGGITGDIIADLKPAEVSEDGTVNCFTTVTSDGIIKLTYRKKYNG